jgi:hypothetical protein
MTRRLLTVLGFVAAFLAAPSIAHANQSPTAAFCAPPVQILNGQEITAPPLMQNFSHAESCGGQYGDLWSDGPIYNASFSFSGSSLSFTIPAMTWIAQGQRIYTQASAYTAPDNSTSYWWLDTSNNNFVNTPSNAPPDATSVLEYTITATAGGISGVVNPTLAAESIPGALSLSALPSGSCLQTGAGGVIQATGLPCGSGSGAIAAVAGSGNITSSTVSGTATVGIVNNPTFTGTPTIASGTTSGSLQFGSDATAFLSRTGTDAFGFSSSGSTTLAVPGGLISGSSGYGPTSATVNGTLTANNVITSTETISGLTPNQCVQTTTGGLLTTTGGSCAGVGSVSSVVAGASGNVTVNTVSGVATVDVVNNPTFTGPVTASSFTGSGAGLTSGSVPNAALATAPVTSVSGSGAISSSGGLTPTISVVSSPGFSGTATSTSFQATGAVVAGSGTALSPTHNDLVASRSTSTGALNLGGTGSNCTIDYGITTGSTITSGCNTNVAGTLAATTLEGTGLTPGNCVQATSGGALTTTSSACGSATSVASVSGTSPVTASTVAGAVTVACATCVTGLTAGSNMSVGSGTTPSVALVSSPSLSGSLGVDGNAAPSSGFAAGASTTPATFTFGGTSSAANSFNFVAPTSHCGTNLASFTVGATAETQIGCNGTVQVGSSTFGATATSVNGQISAHNAIVAGSNTAPSSPTGGDLVGSRSTTSGAVELGGSSQACTVDYNVTTSGWLTAGCSFAVTNAQIYATGANGGILADQYLLAGNSNTPPTLLSSGHLYGVTGASSGTLNLGGNTLLGSLDFGNIAAHTWTFTDNGANQAVAVGDGSLLASFSKTLANAPTLNAGDLGASEGVSTGQLILGGSTTSGTFDFGITNAGAFTTNADIHTTGNHIASGYVEAGSATGPTPTAGDLIASRSTSTGAVVMGGSGSSCRIDFGVTNIGKVGINCGLLTSQSFQVGNLLDSGLSSSTVTPICGGNVANISQCAAQSTVFATTGNVSAASGTSANTYVQLGTNQSITTPATSYGTNNEWLVTVEMPLSIGTGLASENIYGCITSASTFTKQDATTDGSSNCVTTKTNSFAGGPAFGEQSASGLAQYGLTQMIKATLIVANSTTLTVSGFIAGSTTTSVTIYGFLHISAVPY